MNSIATRPGFGLSDLWNANFNAATAPAFWDFLCGGSVFKSRRHFFWKHLLCIGLFSTTVIYPACGQSLVAHLVSPTGTDPGITNFTADHHAYLATNVPPRNKLFLFIPGTTAIPADYTHITRTAAEMGFHAMSLAYVNDESVNALCGHAATSLLFEQVRLEILDGTDRSTTVNVSRTDSLENRLMKFLHYADAHWPEENWGQYLDGTNILWTNLIVAGHSQGGGHAGILAKQHEVARCLMFDATDWWIPGKRPANWIYTPGATPAHRYFALAHLLDPIGSNTFHVTWIAYGLPQFGSERLFEAESGPPYSWSHSFWTDTEPTRTPDGGDNDYHNGPVVDWCLPFAADGITPLYKPIWQFMLAGPIREPDLRIEPAPDSSVTLSFQTSTGTRYQLQTSTNLTAWVASPFVMEGDDGRATLTCIANQPRIFYRLQVAW